MSSNKNHEVILVGAGHNGLVVAAYLAKAGVNVGVVEGLDYIGGGCQTRENTLPGFKQEMYSVLHSFIMANPMLLHDEIGLFSKYGLKYIYVDESYANIFPDGSYIHLYYDVDKTCESIAKISPRDAEAYRKFLNLSNSVLETVMPAFFAPPPNLGQLMAMLESSTQGQEIMRVMLMSSLDVVNEWFYDDRVKIALLKMANESMMYPDAKGTGVNLFLLVPITHKYKWGTPRGGGIELPNALVRCLEANGGKVYTGSPVTKITTAGGRATGVILASGEKLDAKRAVISAINVKSLFGGGMIDGLPEDLVMKIRRINPCNHSTLVANYALNEAPKYKAGNINTIMVELLPFMDGFVQHYDDCRDGIPPRQPVPYIACHTLYDDTKAPAGKHCIQLYDPSPYRLRDGGAQKWDKIKMEQEDRKLSWVREFTTNMGDENILGRAVKSPLDLERSSLGNFWQGDIQGIGVDLYQFLGGRPIPSLGHYRTPIDGLYLCGMTSHPAGGISGGGRAAVQVIMEDMGIDFEDVIS